MQRDGVAATCCQVDVEDTVEPRTWPATEALLAGAGLHEDVRSLARDVFARLAETESRAQGVPTEDVHFDVASLQAIAEVVGVCAGVGHLEIQRLVVSPGPAVLEQSTPIGAALLTALADDWGAEPSMTVSDVGIGAEHEPDGSALLRLSVGEADSRRPERLGESLMDLAVIAVVFGAIFVVELPDKTFIAALVLSTRYKPLLVWIGVGLAFFVQTLIAVLAGHLTTYLPDVLVKSVAMVIFLIGAIVLFRSAPGADAEEKETEEEYAAKATDARTGLKAVTASFLVLFAAEWGDLSQLLTISMVAHYGHPASVFIGAWAALLAVSGLAVLVGRVLLQHVRLSLIHYLGAAVCLVLAGLIAWDLLNA